MYRIKKRSSAIQLLKMLVQRDLSTVLMALALFSSGYGTDRNEIKADTGGAKPLLVLEDANHPVITADGRRIAVLPEIGVVEVYEVSPKRKLRSFRIAGASRQWISSDGRTLAIVGRNARLPFVAFLDVESGKEIRRVGAGLKIGERVIGGVDSNSTASSDLRLMTATASNQLRQGADHKGVMIVNTQTGKIEQGFGELGHQFKGESMTTDGRVIAATRSSHGFAERNETIVWEVESGRELLRLPFHSHWLSLSEDGRRLATNRKVEGGFPADRIRVTPDGKLHVEPLRIPGGKGGHYLTEVWDVQTGRRVQHIGESYRNTPPTMLNGALSPDGSLLATASKQYIVLWDVNTGKPLAAQPHVEDSRRDVVKNVAFSGNGQFLVMGSSAEIVKVWSIGNLLEDAALKSSRSSSRRVGMN